MTESDTARDETSPGRDASAEVVLPPRLEMRSVNEVAAAIRATDGPLVVKADRVELVTSPGAQLLLATLRCGREVKIVEPSAAFLDCLALLGIGPDRLNSEGATP